MSDYLMRGDAPFSDEEWERLDDLVVDVARKLLVGRRFIFLVDNSASMQATDVAPSRLEEAKRRVRELVDQMGSGDAAMIISFADAAVIEQPFTYSRADLRRAVDAIQPTQRFCAPIIGITV